MNIIRAAHYTMLAMILGAGIDSSASGQQRTSCNPMNIDYAHTPIPNAAAKGNHRATADPVITLFKGHYYLFSTNQWGYWWSDDMLQWNFVPRKFLKPWHKVHDELCAPATLVLGDTLFVLGSAHTPDFPVWMSTNPQVDDWKEAVDSFWVPSVKSSALAEGLSPSGVQASDGTPERKGAWDPAFFLDDDGRVYVYYGSSNVYPIYGIEIDRTIFQPIGEPKELICLHSDVYGWERFGEHNDNTFLDPFIEGAWMDKHNGKYYLQYGAPGTEFSGYADGVYVGVHPLGPFTYQPHNPFSYKPGGFARGAGHGGTFQDRFGNWWHVATIAISVKNNFERRIGMFPAGFDKDGVLYANTAYGDYPHDLARTERDHLQSHFAGWMLLNYNKPVMISSTLGGYAPNFAVDEDIRTYWSAASGNKGEWLQSDLGQVCTVHAVQVNYADQDAEFVGRQPGIYHRYMLYHSLDGKDWKVLVDKSRNTTDVPHDYVELVKPVQARFVKIENIHMPTGKFALSDLRVFGKGQGKKPAPVRDFVVLRGESERRNAWLKWRSSDDATGYTIYMGIAPDKLYNNVMVYGSNEYYFRGMHRDTPYYFQIEAFNENGVGERTPVMKVD